MAEGNFVQAAILKFDGHYDHWSMLMENLLRSKELECRGRWNSYSTYWCFPRTPED
ncbi:hypothetical protein SESBI_29994 [Sesbania bispinosa]|nr:hypothetical protein SESBI_29994 [Sesbania bispinosa]